MVPAAIVAAVLVEVVAWRVVAAGRGTVWGLMIAVFALHALVAVALGGVTGPGDDGPAIAAAAGAGAGLALYAGTLAFVAVAVRFPPFRRDVEDRYEHARVIPLATALILSLSVAVPGEELFWRGLVQGEIASATSPLVGAALAWAGYVAVNLFAGNLPFAAGAIVGGAVWGALAWWTGGVLASLVCHAVWTALMLSFPPASARGMIPA